MLLKFFNLKRSRYVCLHANRTYFSEYVVELKQGCAGGPWQNEDG